MSNATKIWVQTVGDEGPGIPVPCPCPQPEQFPRMCALPGKVGFLELQVTDQGSFDKEKSLMLFSVFVCFCFIVVNLIWIVFQQLMSPLLPTDSFGDWCLCVDYKLLCVDYKVFRNTLNSLLQSCFLMYLIFLFILVLIVFLFLVLFLVFRFQCPHY